MKRCTLALLLAVILSSCSPDPVPEAEVAVRVESVSLDPRSNSPVLVLGELEGDRRLPIWIGFSEAQSIATVLENQRQLRPNTHDLAKRLIDQLDGDVERVVVTRLSQEIYYALIVVKAQGRILEIDARPSDAIAIGLRYEAPLFVREGVFERSVEGTTEEEGGREVRRAPAPDEPESHRQVATSRRRFHNANAFWRSGEGRSAIREWGGADLRHRALTQATRECRVDA